MYIFVYIYVGLSTPMYHIVHFPLLARTYAVRYISATRAPLSLSSGYKKPVLSDSTRAIRHWHRSCG